MDIKRIHEMLEKLTECAKAEFDKGMEQVDVEEMSLVIDMIKDLACAEKDRRMAKQIEQSEEEEKKSDEHFLRMLKDEYGEDEGKRYYDNYRYRTTGRFAPKGRGSYSPSRGRSSRGYEEMPYFYEPEWYRDMDRMLMNRMYYSGGGSSGGNTGGNSGGSSGGGASGASSGGSSGGSNGGSMGYSEGNARGYAEGESRGYQRGYSEGRAEGYSQGRSDGRNSGNRNESRSERARRNYTETKSMNKGGSAQEKQNNMRELENYFSELGEDMAELVKNMSQEEKNLMRTKLNQLSAKV